MIVKSRKMSGGKKLGENEQRTDSKSVRRNVHTEGKGGAQSLTQGGGG